MHPSQVERKRRYRMQTNQRKIVGHQFPMKIPIKVKGDSNMLGVMAGWVEEITYTART